MELVHGGERKQGRCARLGGVPAGDVRDPRDGQLSLRYRLSPAPAG